MVAKLDQARYFGTLPEITTTASRDVGWRDVLSWRDLLGIGAAATVADPNDRLVRWTDVVLRGVMQRSQQVNSAVAKWAQKILEGSIATVNDAMQLTSLKRYEIEALAAGKLPARLAQSGLTWAQMEQLLAQAAASPAARVATAAGRTFLGPELFIATIIGEVIAETLNRVSQSALDEAGRAATETTVLPRPDSVSVPMPSTQPVPSGSPVTTLAPIDAVSTSTATLPRGDFLSDPLSTTSPSVDITPKELPTPDSPFLPTPASPGRDPGIDFRDWTQTNLAPATQTQPQPQRATPPRGGETPEKDCPRPKRKPGKCQVGLWREFKDGTIKYEYWREWKCP